MAKEQGFLWIDIAGLALTQDDKMILEHPKVSGVVLFAKNFESVCQLKDLTREIASVRPDLMITADQEGGRVQRFVTGFTQLPSMSYWGDQYRNSPKQGLQNFGNTLSTMTAELRSVGVHAPIAPVLDIDYGCSAVIGERSFGADADLVCVLSSYFIDSLHRLRVPVIGKHFPGHGWVKGDSHHTLPVDSRSFSDIQSSDLKPYSQLVSKLDAIMPAHIIYSTVDDLPAGFSRFWLQDVLRKQLGFDGLIITDDLTMQGAATYGDYGTRAEMALAAGADILTVCNARDGVIEILDGVRKQHNDLFAQRWRRYCRYR